MRRFLLIFFLLAAVGQARGQAIWVNTPIHTNQPFNRALPMQTWECSAPQATLGTNMVEFLDTDGTVNGYVDCHGNIVGVASTTSWSAITSPTSNLVLSMGTHNTAWDYTAGGAGLLLDNTASATSSVQQDSPYLQIEGQAWTGSASRPDGFEIEHILSTNTALLTFIHTGGYVGETTGLSMPALDLQPIAAALLPAAASYTGWCLRVSNSTAITVEGQTCVDAGIGGGPALAFSNGSIWKCF